MVDKKASRVIDSWKQKKWYDINSPSSFGARKVGEAVAASDDVLKGRTVKMSLSVVTGDVKKQNTSVTFEIVDVKNGAAETVVKKIEINPSSIRRMIRKGKNRIDLSIVCATKDNVIVRIKPFLVTRAMVGGSILTKMRNLLDALIRNELIKVSYDSLIGDILSNRLQKRLKQIVGKIYPVRTSEIRIIERTKTDKALLPIPKLPEFKEEKVELTEEEKLERKMKQIEEEETKKESTEKPKKAKEKKKEEKPLEVAA